MARFHVEKTESYSEKVTSLEEARPVTNMAAKLARNLPERRD